MLRKSPAPTGVRRDSQEETAMAFIEQLKQRKWRLGRRAQLALIVALPPIFFWGYCHGWWLKNVPILYSLLFCKCPAWAEPNFHPDNVEVIVPACRNPSEASLSWDGRYLLSSQLVADRNNFHLLDLKTGSDQELTKLFRGAGAFGLAPFVTETLIWAEPDGNPGPPHPEFGGGQAPPLRLPFGVRHSSFVIRRGTSPAPTVAFRRSSFVVRNSSLVIRYF